MLIIEVYPIASMTLLDTALCMPLVLAILHGPLLLHATFLAVCALSPSSTSRLYRVRGFFHCRQRISRILRLIQLSKSSKTLCSPARPK